MYETQTQIPSARLSAYPNGGTQMAPAASGSAMLDSLSQRLGVASERVSAAANHVRNVADGLFGPEPETKAEAGNIKAPPQGRIWNLNDQAESVHYWLTELERQIDRLNPLG